MDANYVFSAEDTRAPERFDYWRELTRAVVGVEVTPLERTPQSFAASLQLRAKASLQAIRYEGDATLVQRGERQIADRLWNSYMIYIERSDGARIAFGQHDAGSVCGAIVFGDPDHPFETEPATRYCNDLLVLPKSMFAPHLPRKAISPVSPLSGRSGVTLLAASYIETLLREWDNIGEAEMPGVADTLCQLIGVALGAAAEDHADAVHSGRAAQIRRHIDRHLADPSLSPATAAAALRLSVRGLHAALERSGDSFAALVRQRRLAACRSALLAQPARPVTDIAFAWGFNSLPSFYRGFRAEFGASPGDLRQAAQAAAPGPSPA
jgi:AraC family transcriptional activator of tynA and feaB